MTTLYQVQIHYNLRLRMRDGIELSANLWQPVATRPDEKCPAILEMIPYRKDDHRYNTDHRHGQYWAERGFAFCRLDVRGTGSSDGIAYGEYMPEQTQDGYDVVEWLAGQEWCNGNVGMWGISWGGFTSIQVAKLQPPHLKAIIPMYATDDRYLDDVHYLGGCVSLADHSQYAVSMVGMNAMPPQIDYTPNWAEKWKARLEATPFWLFDWLKHQTDGPFWRSGSLAPEYDQIQCAVFNIGGWMDPYVDPALRMQAHSAAPSKTLIGNWVHSYPSHAYPAPNLDHLHEMERFFTHWLKGEEDGVMDEPPLTLFRREYTQPEAFPARFNGEWVSLPRFPVAESKPTDFYLGDKTLSASPAPANTPPDSLRHMPAHGTRASLCWGAGHAPNGLARDLRPDEALIPTFTSEPLTEPLDILGFPEAVIYLSCDSPIANVIVRLTDVAPDGTSSQVTAGILNLTHRDSHSNPQPLTPDHIYEVRVKMRSTAYRFLPGHRIRLSLASGYLPVVFPAPYPFTLTLYHNSENPSRLNLPVVPTSVYLTPPTFKTTPPDLISSGGGASDDPVWQIVEDVLNQTTTVHIYEGGPDLLPDGRVLYNSERIEITSHASDPLRARMYNEVIYRFDDHGYKIEIIASGTKRATEKEFHLDVQLLVKLNGTEFFRKSQIESIPRRLV
ncbi:MAG: CocE/NonD family hydrolase [Anaerolineae bacterium]|nr:CocE/NonD family hydrolase [Anaerolineae bacterium]